VAGTSSRNLAAMWLRGAFHDQGTGSQASLVRFPNTGPNAGMGGSVATNFIQGAQGSISSADVIQIAGIVALKKCGGIDVPIALGRRDNLNVPVSILDRIPSPAETFQRVTAKFQQMGLNKQEMMVLSKLFHLFPLVLVG
jgi:L-ascorbate peroxidase